MCRSIMAARGRCHPRTRNQQPVPPVPLPTICTCISMGFRLADSGGREGVWAITILAGYSNRSRKQSGQGASGYCRRSADFSPQQLPNAPRFGDVPQPSRHSMLLRTEVRAPVPAGRKVRELLRPGTAALRSFPSQIFKRRRSFPVRQLWRQWSLCPKAE